MVVFHEDIDPANQARLRRVCSSPIDFEQLHFSLPAWLTPEQARELPWRVGYCHMCQWFSGDIFSHPRLRAVDWYLRLDIDSYILSPVEDDPFRRLEKAGKSYGYLTTFYEEVQVSNGLAEAVDRFVRDKKIVPTFLQKHLTKDGQWNRMSFYTNFEIAQLDFWRSPDFARFWEFINTERGIYLNRWGDAPLHFIALSLMVEEERIARLDGIGYRHVNYFSVP